VVADASSAGEAPRQGHGADPEGRVRAVAEQARVKTLRIQPRAMALPPDELAECARTAVNEALADLRSAMPSDAGPGVDPAAVLEYLNQVQVEGLRTLELVTGALEQAMAQIRQTAAAHGTPAPHGLHGIVEEVQQTLAAVSRPPQEAPDDLEGTAEAAQGRVRAVAEPGGRIRSLTVQARAMRSPSQELAEHIVTAVNNALDDLQAKTRRETGIVEIDQRRLDELRESAMRQSAEFMRSVSDMINSIQPR